MKKERNKIGYHVGYPTVAGVTLVEILVVVVIIAILMAAVISVATRIDTQGKEHLTENTIALLTAAVGQFGSYGYTYSDPCYSAFKFPLDCNGFNKTDLESELRAALGTTVSINSGVIHDVNYSGCEAMYFLLSRVPESRQTLDRLDRKVVTNLDVDGKPMIITVGSQVYPLFRVIDPWGQTLRYDYYGEKLPLPHSTADIDAMVKSRKTFPVITSAGPDKVFGTDDDIKNR